ncbi:hypothetical protein [Oceanobacillus arenosus]|uniref:hypothetical protein n=1 Tax=Oceanobacillus arenosus TaxID=1229153 RepID=UPI0014733DD1|nr:hypothetical protein [Oceanobacillus arenosus]
MATNQGKQNNYESTENKERIANMINEGGIGVTAYYHYEAPKKQETSVQAEK